MGTIRGATHCLGGRLGRARDLPEPRSAAVSACPGVIAVRPGSLPDRARSGHGRPALYEVTGNPDASRGRARRDVDGVRGVALDLGTVEGHFRAVPGELVAARRKIQPKPAVITRSHRELSGRRIGGHHLSGHRPDPAHRPAEDQRARHGSTMAGQGGLVRGASGHGCRDGQC